MLPKSYQGPRSPSAHVRRERDCSEIDQSTDLRVEAYCYGKPLHNHRDGECYTLGFDECSPEIRVDADVRFEFFKVSVDGERAVFKPSKGSKANESSIRLEVLNISHATNSMLIKPTHMVKIGKQVNDTYLPNLTINRGERTFALNWKLMFSIFFIEEKKFYRACRDWVNPPMTTCGLSTHPFLGQQSRLARADARLRQSPRESR